eukprot:40346-Prymnesium_polylepis.1
MPPNPLPLLLPRRKAEQALAQGSRLKLGGGREQVVIREQQAQHRIIGAFHLDVLHQTHSVAVVWEVAVDEPGVPDQKVARADGRALSMRSERVALGKIQLNARFGRHHEPVVHRSAVGGRPAPHNLVASRYAEEASVVMTAIRQCQHRLRTQGVATIRERVHDLPREGGGPARERVHVPVQPVFASLGAPFGPVHDLLRAVFIRWQLDAAGGSHGAGSRNVHVQPLSPEQRRECAMDPWRLPVCEELRGEHKGVAQDAELRQRRPFLPRSRIVSAQALALALQK